MTNCCPEIGNQTETISDSSDIGGAPVPLRAWQPSPPSWDNIQFWGACFPALVFVIYCMKLKIMQSHSLSLSE